MRAQPEGGGVIIPVDSEHSAIHQCIAGRPGSEVSRLILTASGGPFRETPAAEFAGLRAADALAHPTWDMGAKITIDSATLANKALEVIEAHLLFDKEFDDIEVVVHPSSIVHSFVEFRDGSTMAQLGYPTMELPVLYALGAPERLANDFEPLDPRGGRRGCAPGGNAIAPATGGRGPRRRPAPRPRRWRGCARGSRPCP
jgi:1-deoxy-D-xylulose-5-phosphate reductoisomerase